MKLEEKIVIAEYECPANYKPEIAMAYAAVAVIGFLIGVFVTYIVMH